MQEMFMQDYDSDRLNTWTMSCAGTYLIIIFLITTFCGCSSEKDNRPPDRLPRTQDYILDPHEIILLDTTASYNDYAIEVARDTLGNISVKYSIPDGPACTSAMLRVGYSHPSVGFSPWEDYSKGLLLEMIYLGCTPGLYLLKWDKRNTGPFPRGKLFFTLEIKEAYGDTSITYTRGIAEAYSR